MAKKQSAQIPLDALNILFDDYDLWAKIRDGRLLSTIVVVRDAMSHHYPNALSRIVKHSFPNGTHVCTSHRIEDQEGAILHEDAKDIHFSDLVLWRK